MMSKKRKRKPQSAGMDRGTRDLLMLSGNPIWRAFSKVPVSQRTQTSIGLASRKALYALTTGEGEFAHCKELIVSAYAGIYLAEQGFGDEFLVDFYDALDVLHACNERVSDSEDYWLDEEEARKVDVLLDLHEQQLKLADKAALAAAIVESYNRSGNPEFRYRPGHLRR